MPQSLQPTRFFEVLAGLLIVNVLISMTMTPPIGSSRSLWEKPLVATAVAVTTTAAGLIIGVGVVRLSRARTGLKWAIIALITDLLLLTAGWALYQCFFLVPAQEGTPAIIGAVILLVDIPLFLLIPTATCAFALLAVPPGATRSCNSCDDQSTCHSAP